MHQISVIGDTEEILCALCVPEDIKFEIEDEKVTFMSESTKAIENIKEKLSDVIVKIIQEKYSRNFICKLSKNADYNFDGEVRECLSNDLSDGKRIIEKKLKEFLSEANSISIDGFVKFRLREYEEYLQKRMDIYEEKMTSVREIDDLIELLKIYVKVQPCIEKVIQIFVLPFGGYILKNQQGEDITEKCIKDFITYKSFTEMSFDDILLSCLIMAAPEKIIIHGLSNIKNSEFITVIEKVFAGSVERCEGCTGCHDFTQI